MHEAHHFNSCISLGHFCCHARVFAVNCQLCTSARPASDPQLLFCGGRDRFRILFSLHVWQAAVLLAHYCPSGWKNLHLAEPGHQFTQGDTWRWPIRVDLSARASGRAADQQQHPQPARCLIRLLRHLRALCLASWKINERFSKVSLPAEATLRVILWVQKQKTYYTVSQCCLCSTWLKHEIFKIDKALYLDIIFWFSFPVK